MGVTLERVQNKFACIIGELCSEPAVLSKFAIWLDLRLAEYKSKGSISLDCSGENPDPFWLNGHEKEETREIPVGGNLGDYHYSPRAVPRHPSHSPIHRFPPPGGTRTILPESASKDSMTSGPAVFKKESESDDQNDVFPVSLHRIESSQERKRPAAEPISKSHESYSDLHPSKVSRIADDMSSALVEQAMGTNTGFTPSYLHGSDDDFDSSNDDTDTEFNSALAQSQAGASSLPKGDNSLTFSSQNSLSADDSSLQHRLSFQSNTGDLSNLSQDLGSNSDTNTGQLICGICQRAFSFKSSLRRHMKLHGPDLRPHSCDLCPAKFRRLEHLRKHLRSLHRDECTKSTSTATMVVYLSEDLDTLTDSEKGPVSPDD